MSKLIAYNRVRHIKSVRKLAVFLLLLLLLLLLLSHCQRLSPDWATVQGLVGAQRVPDPAE